MFMIFWRCQRGICLDILHRCGCKSTWRNVSNMYFQRGGNYAYYFPPSPHRALPSPKIVREDPQSFDIIYTAEIEDPKWIRYTLAWASTHSVSKLLRGQSTKLSRRQVSISWDNKRRASRRLHLQDLSQSLLIYNYWWNLMSHYQALIYDVTKK